VVVERGIKIVTYYIDLLHVVSYLKKKISHTNNNTGGKHKFKTHV
jgi:hypothetical protein